MCVTGCAVLLLRAMLMHPLQGTLSADMGMGVMIYCRFECLVPV